MELRRLVLVRHGESVWNAQGRIQGQLCAGLSERGHEQSRLLAHEIRSRFPDARLVTSDLPRTRETAAPIAALLGTEPSEDPRVRERSFGDWEGLLRGEVVAGDGERWRQWAAGRDVVAEIGGESAEQLVDRVVPVFRQLLASTPPGSATVVVTHGGPVWHGTHVLLGLERPSLGPVANASLTVVGSVDGETWLERFSEDAHLPFELRGTRADTDRLEQAPPPVGR